MARPIEPTPPVKGQDAVDLLESLEDVASPEEMAARREASRRRLYGAHRAALARCLDEYLRQKTMELGMPPSMAPRVVWR